MADEILVALRRVVRAIDLRSHEMVAQCGLTTPQFLVLRAVAGNPGQCVGQISKAVHLSQATVTGILLRLERQGLVCRMRDTRDRRRTSVTILPAGQEALHRAPMPLQERFLTSLAGLQEWERTQLLASLQRVVGMLEAEDIDAGPVLAPGSLDSNPPPAQTA